MAAASDRTAAGPGDDAVTYGVDVGGTKVLGVAIDPPGKVLAEARVLTPPALAHPAGGSDEAARGELVESVGAVVAELVAATHGERNADADADVVHPSIRLGVGVPGMLGTDGRLYFSPNLPGAAGSDVAGLGARFPGVVVDNDANCAALAERQLGAAAGCDHVLVVTLGTGIGGGVIQTGVIQRGGRGFAGEIGHMVIDSAGPPCPCGGRGCWERYASGGGLGRLAREAALAGSLNEAVALAGGDPEYVRGEHVTRAAQSGDPGALAVMAELGRWIAVGLANLVAVLDPERIVIGGGLAEAGDLLLDPVRLALADLVEGGRHRPPVAVVPATLGERAGAVGAALMARHHASETNES